MSTVAPYTNAISINEQQKQNYKEKGFFILENVIPVEHLELLRNDCQFFIDNADAAMDAAGTDVLGLNHRAKRYFVSDACKQSKRLKEFVFSELMANICHATLGPDAFLFWDQYVVKGAEVGMKFGWHQDSGYVGHPHRPYLTCWCALDDMVLANGTIFVLPYDRAGTRDLVSHVIEEGTNDKVGYHGSDLGDPVIVPAGSIAVFSSTMFHRSGANTTDKMRRVYLAQYSAEIILDKEGLKPRGQCVPILKNGERVLNPRIGL